MLQQDYYLLQVRSILGVKALSPTDEAHILQSRDLGLSPELAADHLKLEWLMPANQQGVAHDGA